MGDFNTAWNAEPITLFIDHGFGDSKLLSQTVPDHILSTLKIVSYSEAPSAYSDHPMITAEIKSPVTFQSGVLPPALDLITD